MKERIQIKLKICGFLILIAIAPAICRAADNVFEPDCTGEYCAAKDTHTYNGQGLGIWQYRNTLANDATLNIKLQNVVPEKHITLIFSNGQEKNAGHVPVTGHSATLTSVQTTPSSTNLQSTHSSYTAPLRARNAIAEKNKTIAKQLINGHLSNRKLKDEREAKYLATRIVLPAIGTRRTWNDHAADPAIQHTAIVKEICSLPGGRNGVLWVDEKIKDITPAMLTTIKKVFCGNEGGFGQITTALGEPWGSHHYADLIEDSEQKKLDINIVFLAFPEGSSLAGYFINSDTFKVSSKVPLSNEALAFYINAPEFIKNQISTLSALIHEFTHMIDFYQHTVKRSQVHETWLSETLAMMTEDIFGPRLLPEHRNEVQAYYLYEYIRSGGAINLSRWAQPNEDVGPYYAQGATFGAFLNRRYGMKIYKNIVSNCDDQSSSNATEDHSSYKCLNKLIQNAGGKSFQDEFDRFGASIFGLLPSTQLPKGYGFLATSGDYPLIALDPSVWKDKRLTQANPLPHNQYEATLHTYITDVVAANQNTYSRNGITIPAGTTLSVVIQ